MGRHEIYNPTLHVLNVEEYVGWGCILNLLPADYMQSTRPAGPKITLHFPCLLYLCMYLCVSTYRVDNNYVTNIVVMQPYFIVDSGNLDSCFV